MTEQKAQYCECDEAPRRVYDDLDATFQMLMPTDFDTLPGESPRDAEARWLQEIAS